MIDVIQDLNEYLGTNYSIEEMERERAIRCSMVNEQLIKAYQIANNNKSEAMKYFYANTDLYLYDLVVWEGAQKERTIFTNWMIKFSRKYGVKKIFDFGMGVGSDAIPLAKAGFEVSGCEVGKHVDFLKWRIKKHGVNIKVFSEFPNEQVDMVILLAVIEHIWEPIKLLTHLSHYTKYFTWIIDLHDDGTDQGMHCVEFYKQLDPFTEKVLIECDGIEYSRMWPEEIDHGRPQFYGVKVLNV